jgi:hypothetical protein
MVVKERYTFVVFTMDSTRKMWWQLFLKKPFYHVFVLEAIVTKCGKHYISIVDPVVNFKKWCVKPRCKKFEVAHWYSYMAKYRELCIKDYGGFKPRVLKIKIDIDKYNFTYNVISIIPLCTVYVARMFNIKAFAVTPFQLYKVLKNIGCSNLF